MRFKLHPLLRAAILVAVIAHGLAWLALVGGGGFLAIHCSAQLLGVVRTPQPLCPVPDHSGVGALLGWLLLYGCARVLTGVQWHRLSEQSTSAAATSGSCSQPLKSEHDILRKNSSS